MSNTAAPRTVAHWAPLSVEFPQQEYWTGLPLWSPGDLPDSRIEPGSLALAGGLLYLWATREACIINSFLELLWLPHAKS